MLFLNFGIPNLFLLYYILGSDFSQKGGCLCPMNSFIDKFLKNKCEKLYT